MHLPVRSFLNNVFLTMQLRLIFPVIVTRRRLRHVEGPTLLLPADEPEACERDGDNRSYREGRMLGPRFRISRPRPLVVMLLMLVDSHEARRSLEGVRRAREEGWGGETCPRGWRGCPSRIEARLKRTRPPPRSWLAGPTYSVS